MKLLCPTLLLMATLMSTTPVVSEENFGNLDPMTRNIGGLLTRALIQQNLNGCHLLFITTSDYSPIFHSTIRRSSSLLESGVTVLAAEKLLFQDRILKDTWKDARITCRVIVLELIANPNATDEALRSLESSGLWKRPFVRILVLGGRDGVRSVLFHRALRNTIHAVYFALSRITLQADPDNRETWLLTETMKQEAREGVLVYRRCPFCSEGQPDVRLILRLNLTSGLQQADQLFQEHPLNLMGRKLYGVTVKYFPFIDYKKDYEGLGSTVTLKDSVDTSLLLAISAALNFTYEIREDPDVTWGKWNGGKFNGMVGRLQREETDFSTSTAPQPHRLEVIDHVRGYPSDLMTVISPKPSLLPQQLAFVRPFAGELWAALLASVVAWSLILWLLQRTWCWMTGERRASFSTGFLYSWGVLLEETCRDPSVNLSAQVLVGWWLLFCLVITTGFRSSLIARLSVQEKSQPLETLEDILEQDDWKWGTESTLFKGSVVEYFTSHQDPVLKEITERMEVLDPREGLRKVLSGGFTLIAFKYVISEVIAVHFLDSRGQSPFYISNKGFYVLPLLGWGLRKGSPYASRLNKMMLRLEAAGLTSYWTDDVITKLQRRARETASLKPQNLLGEIVQEDDATHVVLGLSHLQGAFYLLLLGLGIAFLALLEETRFHRQISP